MTERFFFKSYFHNIHKCYGIVFHTLKICIHLLIHYIREYLLDKYALLMADVKGG